MTSHVSSCLPMKHRTNIMPRHSRGGVPVNEICPGAPGKDPSLSSVPGDRNTLTSTRIQHNHGQGNTDIQSRNSIIYPLHGPCYMLSFNLQTEQNVNWYKKSKPTCLIGFPFRSVEITAGYQYTQHHTAYLLDIQAQSLRHLSNEGRLRK